MKTAIVFPGQGSQYSGMGQDFYNNYEEARKVFDKASSCLGFSLTEKCFNGSEEELRQTHITQPAILTMSIAIFETLKKNFTDYNGFAGHSLGEYTALYASGVLTLEDVLKLVQKRGECMSKIKGGNLVALMGRDFSKVEDLCRETGYHIAIHNSPKQIILAGRDEDFSSLEEKAGAFGVKRVVKLNVSGPFHSPLMKSAADEFADFAEKFTVNTPDVELYMNVTAVSEKNTDRILENMVRQIYCPVIWKSQIEKMIADGYNRFIEVGPSKVLSGIISNISSEVETLNVEKIEDIEKINNHECCGGQ